MRTKDELKEDKRNWMYFIIAFAVGFVLGTLTVISQILTHNLLGT